MNKPLKRTVVILTILLLSVICGAVCQSIATKYESSNYPRAYSEYVTRYAEEYGVPEYILYAVIRTSSNFESNRVSEAGAVGLLQLTPNIFQELSVMMGSKNDIGMRYNPETSVAYGTYLLSYLYVRYADWNTVFSFFCMAARGEISSFSSLPSAAEADNYKFAYSARRFAGNCEDAMEVYARLYYKNI